MKIWTDFEIITLKENIVGCTMSTLSHLVHHKRKAIENKLNELGLELKPYKCLSCGKYVTYRCTYCNECKNKIIIKTCKNCGNEFSVKYLDYNKIYCSTSCAASGSSNSSWKNPIVHKKCIDAGKITKQNKTDEEKSKSYEKFKQTMLQRYGYEHPTQSSSFRNITCAKISKSLQNRSQIEIINTVKKIVNTKRQNKSFNQSNIEFKIYDFLNNHIQTINHYTSDLYPYECDFYIPKLDLYIEYQGFWTHGFKPFDVNDDSCIALLKKWMKKCEKSKFYKNAIYTWTDLDVRKRKCAKDNKLNWIEFYNIMEFNQWSKSIFNDELIV